MDEIGASGCANTSPDAARAAADRVAWDLADRAGVVALSAGSAVEGEPGWDFRGRLLADQLAAGHGVMMKLAARANHAISNANCMGAGEALFDLQAARLADMSGRMMDRYRRGLKAFGRLAGPAGQPELWQGLCWQGDPPLAPEELERRLARARRLARLNRPGVSPPSAAALAALAAAGETARDLTVEAAAAALASQRDSATRRRLFLDQLAAAHRMMMRLAGRADWQLSAVDAERIDPALRDRATNGLAGAAGRMMDRYRLGLQMLKRGESGPTDGPPRYTGSFWAGSEGGYVPPDPPEMGADPGSPAAAGCGVDRPRSRSGSARGGRAIAGNPENVCAMAGSAARRGRLRHGNPSGDYLKAPRCGARTRAGGCCGQPAMANGRCRFHGGKATGPRTAEGRSRSRAARLVHGGRSAEVIELRAAAAAIGRNIRRLIAESEVAPLAMGCLEQTGERPGAGRALAGHGVDRRVFRKSSTVARGPRLAGRGSAADARQVSVARVRAGRPG